METKRCARLDPDGKRCKSTKVKLYNYHGDPELRTDTGWVAVYLCEEHKGYSTLN